MTSAHAEAAPSAVGRVRALPLAAALAIMVGVTLYPQLLADATGRADHLAALALCWAMSAGYVSGVGFRPRRRLLQAVFSAWMVPAGVLLAVLRMLG